MKDKILSKLNKFYPRIELFRRTIRSPCCDAPLITETSGESAYDVTELRCQKCNKPFCKRYNEPSHLTTKRLGGQLVRRADESWEVVESAYLWHGFYNITTKEGARFRARPDDHGRWCEADPIIVKKD